MIPIEIDKSSGKPLYIQIRDRIEEAVRNQELKPGDRLPPVAALARQVGVTQATIRRAVSDLNEKGLTHCHVGRGTFISEMPVETTAPEPPPPQPIQPDRPAPGLSGAATDPCGPSRLGGNKANGICNMINMAKQPVIAGFAKGIPDPAGVAPGLVQETLAGLMAEHPLGCMDNDCSHGLPELREEIAARYTQKGIDVSPDQVLITNGSQQGAGIVALDAAAKKRRVICEVPCFQGIAESFAMHGNWVGRAPRDDEGPLPKALHDISGHNPGLLYLCPELQSPTGMDISPERQGQIMAWAGRTNSLILCDEIFQDLRYQGKGPDSFLRLMGDDRVVLISSLSKSFMSGLRVGWVVARPERITEFSRIKRLMDQACPPLMQGLVLNLLRSGAYDAHVERIRRIYKSRRDLVLECLETHMPEGVTWTRPNGGFFLWVTLPPGMFSMAVLTAALEKGVNFLPGPVFDMDQGFMNQFRLSWAWTPKAAISRGIEILARIIKGFGDNPSLKSPMGGLGHFQ